MSLAIIYLDVAPSTGAVGAVFAVGFFVVFLGIAFLAYKMLRKTAKMAIRMGVIVTILLIALVGSASLWWFSSSGGSPKLKPPSNRTR